LQAVERQAAIEQQQRTIDQLQSQIQQTEAANGQLRTRLSQNDGEPESTTAKKRTQPQSAAAAMGRQHSGSQKAPKAR
jgi:chromosome segregation ATPase